MCMGAAGMPNNERRILYNGDGGNLLCEFWINWPDRQQRFRVEEIDPEGMKAIAEDSLDELAEAGVDTLSSVVWFNFYASGWPLSNPADGMPDALHPRFTHTGYFPLYQAGYDFLQIVIDRCHERGMEFAACFRMNDRHGHGANSGRFILDHPEWQLKGIPGGPGMNFANEPVRQRLLAYVEDLLASYDDLDGIEYDYMRWCHMFEPGEGQQNAHLLTDFTRKTRQLLDAAAQRHGRKRLVLGTEAEPGRTPCPSINCKKMSKWVSRAWKARAGSTTRPPAQPATGSLTVSVWPREQCVCCPLRVSKIRHACRFSILTFASPAREGISCRFEVSISGVRANGKSRNSLSMEQNSGNIRKTTHSYSGGCAARRDIHC